MMLDFLKLVAAVRHASMVPDEALIFSWRRMLEPLVSKGVFEQPASDRK